MCSRVILTTCDSWPRNRRYSVIYRVSDRCYCEVSIIFMYLFKIYIIWQKYFTCSDWFMGGLDFSVGIYGLLSMTYVCAKLDAEEKNVHFDGVFKKNATIKCLLTLKTCSVITGTASNFNIDTLTERKQGQCISVQTSLSAIK